MSEPASAYSYSEYTIAPSEASLNARWYNQIQQWTHRLPPDTASATESNHHHRSQDTIVSYKPRDADEATERGTILPTHSVSRRASLAERRQWQERQAEYARKVALKGMSSSISNAVRSELTRTSAGTLPKIQEADMGDTLPDPQVDRRSVVSRSKDVVISNSRAPPVSQSTIDIHTKEGNEQHHRDPEKTSPAIPESAKTPATQKGIRTTSHLQNVEDDGGKQPSRGRRPPTPYHAPSNLALTDIPESTIGDHTAEGDDSVRISKTVAFLHAPLISSCPLALE